VSAGTYTWGISGPDFLWFYAGLSAALSAAIACAWWLARGAAGDSTDTTTRELDMFELALLNGGPELAVTTAATKMLHDGVLRRDVDGSLVTALQPGIGACRIEREVFDAVGRRQAIHMDDVQDEMAGNDAIRSLRNSLVEEGLMLKRSRAAWLHSAWLLGAGLAALGVARLSVGASDDKSVGLLIAAVGAVVLATFWLAQQRPNATARGRRIVNRWREDLPGLPQAGQSAFTAALFGAAALWLIDPEIATALGVPRESATGWDWGWLSGRGDGGGCGSGGCGG
jgi:uncharacterized protein (TIGR04222 family)